MTTLQVTEADPEAVDFIFARLWDRGQAELAILGIEPDTARAIIAHQREIGAPTLAMRFDDEPVIVCGLMRTDNPRGMCTWFQATDFFSHHARMITVKLAALMDKTAKDFNLDYIEVFSACVHEHSGRWFGALGFVLDVDYFLTSKGGERLYRFVRKFDRRTA